MKPRILTFIGAACTGKTTLLNACQAQFVSIPHIGFVSEAGRKYFETHEVPEPLRFTASVSAEIQALAMASERSACFTSELVISDRSVLDAPVYSHAMGDVAGAQMLLDRARSWLHAYQQIFLLDPADIAYKRDEVRKESFQVRQQIHYGYLEFLQLNSIPYVLLSGSLPRRMQVVSSFVRATLAQRTGEVVSP